jgi:uncharacterized protein (DUF427 family)
MKATWNGVVVAESDDTVLMDGNHYFPESALKREFVTFSNHKTMCPGKAATYFSRSSTANSTPRPPGPTPTPSLRPKRIRGRIAFWKGVKVAA